MDDVTRPVWHASCFLSRMDRLNCIEPNCRRERAHNRRRCNRCNNARAKARDPQRYAYNRLRANAKRRGKPFDITLDDFREFCHETPYMKGKGRRATCFHVDRINEARGYVRGNLQCLTNSDNRAKYVTFAYGHCSPDDPDTNERGMWFSTRIAERTETVAPF